MTRYSNRTIGFALAGACALLLGLAGPAEADDDRIARAQRL